jgi:hypothetical protein
VMMRDNMGIAVIRQWPSAGRVVKIRVEFVENMTPVPIPNTEVKPAGADGTARVIQMYRDGKVGSRRD